MRTYSFPVSLSSAKELGFLPFPHALTVVVASAALLGFSPAIFAQDTIFEATFQGSALDGAASLSNLDAGTETGSWSGTPHNSILDSDGPNRAALLERGNLNLNADFSSPGTLANGVNISVEASPRRINNGNPGRYSLIKGVASDNSVLFVLGLSGDTGAGDPGHERLSYFNTDFNGDTGGGSAGFPGGVVQTFVGSIGDFPHNQSNNFDETDMVPFELILSATDFDIAIDGATVATDIPYLSPATDISQLNFSTDFNGGTWFDNFLVTQQVAIPEPATITMWTLLGLGVGGFGVCRARRKK